MKKIFNYKFFILVIFIIIIFNNLFTPYTEFFALPTTPTSTSTTSTNTASQYQYLAPDPSGVITSQTWNQFAPVYNQENNYQPSNSNYIDPSNAIASQTVNQLQGNVSNAEIQYYIQNKKFPWDSYVLNNIPWPKTYPNRSIYEMVMKPVDEKQTPTPQALSIFNGTTPPPSS